MAKRERRDRLGFAYFPGETRISDGSPQSRRVIHRFFDRSIRRISGMQRHVRPTDSKCDYDVGAIVLGGIVTDIEHGTGKISIDNDRS